MNELFGCNLQNINNPYKQPPKKYLAFKCHHKKSVCYFYHIRQQHLVVNQHIYRVSISFGKLMVEFE